MPSKHVVIIRSVYSSAANQIARRVGKVVMNGMSLRMVENPVSPLEEPDAEFRVFTELVSRVKRAGFDDRISRGRSGCK